jgi:hypothetical protein
MFSSHGYSDLPCLSSYAYAALAEREIQPIRGNGRNAGIKPLGNRNRTSIQILRYSEEVTVKMYNTEILRYRRCPETGADQVGIFFGGYDTQTTVAVMNRVLPHGLSIQIFDSKTWLSYPSPYAPNDARLVCAIKSDKLYWVTDKDGSYVPDNPTKIIVHKIDRKAAKEARARYKEFKDYVTLTHKVRGGEYTKAEFEEEVGMDFKGTHWSYLNSYCLPENIASEAMYEESLRLALAATGHYQWFNLRQSDNHLAVSSVSIPLSQINKALEHQIRLNHKDTMFYEVETTELKRDPYKKYF